MKNKLLKLIPIIIIIVLFTAPTVYAAFNIGSGNPGRIPVLPGTPGNLPEDIGDTIDPAVLQDALSNNQVSGIPGGNASFEGWSSADGSMFWDPTDSGSQFAIYMDIAGIPGESVADKNKGEIDILSYSFGAVSGTGSDTFKTFRFNKKIDRSSPEFFQAMLNGDNLQTVTVEVRKAGAAQNVILRMVLSNAKVVSYKEKMTGNGGLDEVQLNFTNIEYSYMINDASGIPKEEVKASWNLK